LPHEVVAHYPQVCQLVKTLYGLKQAGQEWNKQLDAKLKKHGYKCLLSNPCAYVRWDGNDFGIILVWVNDLVLVTSSDKMMDHTKVLMHPDELKPFPILIPCTV